MNGQPFVDKPHGLLKFTAYLADCGIVGQNRVEMNQHVDAFAAEKITLDLVYHGVAFYDVFLRRHLDMHGREFPAVAVIVHDEVVSSQNSGVGEDFPADLLNKLRRWGVSKQRIHRVLYETGSAVQYESRDCHRHYAV